LPPIISAKPAGEPAYTQLFQSENQKISYSQKC